jgi:hypothetical protein
MKKLLLIFLISFSGMSLMAQSDYITALTNNGGTSGNGRAPQGLTRYNRSVWLITAAEMTASGFGTGNVVNSLGFTYVGAQDIATTGNMIVYLQNTADATNLKSTTWSTAITGMTTASNASITIPASIGSVDFAFSGGSPFTYTGGALYVAFDYQNAAGAIATVANVASCTNSLAAGLKGAFSPTSAPLTLTSSAFRPETRLGKSVSCARPTNLGFNTPSTTSAILTFNVTTGGTVNLEYGPYNFVPGTGTTITNITSPYTLSGLTPSTAYEYYLKKDCGAGNLSASEGPFPFYTTFQPTSPTYNTGFEIEDFPFLGWLATPNITANSWFLNFGGTGSVLVQEGQYSAVAITPTATAASERIFSRGINLTAGSVATITYYVRNLQQTASTNLASYQLTVGSDQTAASQTTVVATETGLANTTFDLKTYTFVPATTGTYYFSFLHNSPANAVGTHALLVDNFTVSQVLATDSFISNKFSIYPNPTSGLVSLSNSESINVKSVSITDLNGRIVKQNNFDSVSDIQMNISDLSSGVYMMNINSDKGTAVKKLIKE